MHRFHTKLKRLRVGIAINLDATESFHLSRVLRRTGGESIEVFNDEQLFRANILRLGQKEVRIKLMEELPIEHNFVTPRITVFLAAIKLPLFEIALQKLVELGVEAVVPVQTSYTQPTNQLVAKMPRLRKLILEAAKQSHTFPIPELYELTELNKLELSAFELKLAATTERPGEKLSELVKPKIQSVAILIGPEGGFNQSDLDIIAEQGWSFTSLPGGVLRTETAAITFAAGIRFLAQ